MSKEANTPKGERKITMSDLNASNNSALKQVLERARTYDHSKHDAFYKEMAERTLTAGQHMSALVAEVEQLQSLPTLTAKQNERLSDLRDSLETYGASYEGVTVVNA